MPFNNKEYAKEYMKNYYHSNPEKRKKHIKVNTLCAKKRRNFLKKEIFRLLGNKCANPFNLPHPDWCNDIRCLQIDHINGNGEKERKSFSNHSQYMKFIFKQIKEGSKDYQLLCANCNWIKRYENEEYSV